MNKNDEGITDPDTHLLGYEIRRAGGTPLHERTRVKVENQFGSLTVDTIRSDRLLLPTAKDIDSEPAPPDPESHKVDHFKCYTVEIPRDAAEFEPKEVFLADQFEERPYLVERPNRLCNPVDKQGEEIKNNADHLMCYHAEPLPDTPRHAGVRGLHVNNQFGSLRLDTLRESKWHRHHENGATKELCVPSTKEIVGPAFSGSSPKQLKLDAITALEQISTSDEIIKRTIEKAARTISRSLEYKGRALFLDKFRVVPPPRGEVVFRRELRAVERLRKAIKKDHTPADVKTVFREVIDILVEADRWIAEHSITIAQTLIHVGEGNGEKVAKAQWLFERALDEMNPWKAIQGFKEAWESSQEVVRGKRLVIKSFNDSPEPFPPTVTSSTLTATFQILQDKHRHKNNYRGRRYDREDDDDDGNKRFRHGDDDVDEEKDDATLILAFVEIIQDSLGNLVRTLNTEHPVPSPHQNDKGRSVEMVATSVWDGKDENEEFVPPGTYSYIAFGSLVQPGSSWNHEGYSIRWWYEFLKSRYRKEHKEHDEIEFESISFPVIGTIALGNTLPMITASAAPAPNAEGWNNTNVTVSTSMAGTIPMLQ